MSFGQQNSLAVGGTGYVQVWRADQYGRMCGTEADPDNIADDTTTHALLLPGVRDFDPGRPDRPSVPLIGYNDRNSSNFYFPAAGGQGSLVLQAYNYLLAQMTQGGADDTTLVDGWRIRGVNSLRANLNRIGICISQLVQDPVEGSDGATHWLNRIYLIRLHARQAGGSFQGVPDNSMSFTIEEMDRMPNGILLSSTTLDLTEGKTDELPIESDEPIAFTTHIVPDTAAAGFTLGYLPTSNVVTVATEPNFLTRNNTEEAPTSVNTSTGAVVGATGAQSDFLSIMYGSNFVAIPS